MTDPKTQLQDLWSTDRLWLQPEPLVIYKPSQRDPAKGNALKVNMRLKPELATSDKGVVFVKDVTGGLFLDMPRQTGRDGDGNATFDWQNRDTMVTAKLGRKDIVQLRYAIPEYRAVERFKPGAGRVPPVLQPKPTAERPVDPEVGRRSIVLFHKNATSSTVITYMMEPDGAILQLSTPTPGKRRSIKLDVFEELDFLEYLAHAHRAFTMTGKR